MSDVLVPGEARAKMLAGMILRATGDAVVEVGVGETFLCWAASEEAVLLARDPAGTGSAALEVVAACSAVALRLGVRTPRVIRVGDHPHPHAVMERVWAKAADNEASGRAQLYEAVGAQLAALDLATVDGAGDVIAPEGELRGRSTDWRSHCENFNARVTSAEPTDPRVALVRSLSELSDAHWRTLADMIRDHGHRKARLCHYDNRLPNLPMDDTGVWILDWNLARIAPLSHELIKLYERPPDQARADAISFLNGYGLPAAGHDDILTDALTALAMDGLAMSLEWASEPLYHGGIRGWLSTIKRVITGEMR